MFRWEQLLAHRHWVSLHVFGRELHLCARCSGIVLGFLGSRSFLAFLPFLMSYPIPLPVALSVSLLLSLPSIIDWVTQSLGFRQSNNGLRLKVGFLEGVGVVFLGLAEASTTVKLIVIAAFGLGVIFIGFFGRRLVRR